MADRRGREQRSGLISRLDARSASGPNQSASPACAFFAPQSGDHRIGGAICESHALKIHLRSLMTQPGETDGSLASATPVGNTLRVECAADALSQALSGEIVLTA
ncbi:MAG TPA: hypothetical protein VN519_00720 [Bryobacteraceae bacterium]|nr:hypothetical protein [Bryobacteraceae bacterium]